MSTTEYNNDLIKPLSLSDVWNTLYRRKLFIIATILIALVLGLAVYKLAPRLYIAKSVVLLENQQRNLEMKAVLTTEQNDGMLIPSEIQVLISRDLMGKVVDRLGLVQNPSLLTKSPKAKPDIMFKLTPEEFERRRGVMIDQALAPLRVRQVEKSRAIEISYTARNPQIAADIINTLTTVYIEQQLTSNFDNVRMTNEWLAGRVEEIQEKVMEADRKVAKYRADAGIVDSRGIDLIEQNITELSNKLTAAKADAAATESRLSEIKDKNKLDAAPEILAAPLIQDLRQREAENRDQLAALENQLGPSHPKVLTARAQVNEISDKIKQEIDKLAEGLRRQHQASLDNVANITKQLDVLKSEYNKYKSDNVELSALESEAQINRSFLETLNLRLKETQSQEDNKFQIPYAKVISPAKAPDYAASPRGKLIMAIALVLGLIMGTGLALLLDHIQFGVYNGKQIQEYSGKINIAVVPKAKLDPHKGLVSYADFPLQFPLSYFMESIRSLTMFIRLERSKNPSSKVFNFTSASTGEGKSAVALSVAQQLAVEGVKVLAIDCDMRQPTLTKTFGLKDQKGLNEILQGKTPVQEVIYRDPKSGASFVGVGGAQDLNVISSSIEEWQKVLSQFSESFDIIILDGPSAATFAEGKLIAKLSQNIICVRWKKTPLKLLGFMLDTLKRLDAPVLGTVITMADSRKA